MSNEELCENIISAELSLTERGCVDNLLAQRSRLFGKYDVDDLRDFIALSPDAEDVKLLIKLYESLRMISRKKETPHQVMYEYVKGFFGENFFGTDEVESAFMVDGVKQIELSESDRMHAMKRLVGRMRADDLGGFFEKCMSGELDPVDFRLVLRVPRFVDGEKTTAENISGRCQLKLSSPPDFQNFTQNVFFKSGGAAKKRFEWKVVSRDVLLDSSECSYEEKEECVRSMVESVGVDRKKGSVRRFTEVLYDNVVFGLKGDHFPEVTASRVGGIGPKLVTVFLTETGTHTLVLTNDDAECPPVVRCQF